MLVPLHEVRAKAFRRTRESRELQTFHQLAEQACHHTWATLALESGRSIRWVADQLGHADPAMTLRVYAHAMPAEEADLSFDSKGTRTRARPAAY